MITSEYISTCVENAVHSKWWTTYTQGNLPLKILRECPCKWCIAREKKMKQTKEQ